MNPGTDGNLLFELELPFIPDQRVRHQSVFQHADGITQVSSVAGSTGTFYVNEPAVWLGKVMEAARESMVWQALVRQEVQLPGRSQTIINTEPIKQASSDFATSSEEYTTADTDMTFTVAQADLGKVFEPVDESYGHAFTYRSLRRNRADLVGRGRDNLKYHQGRKIDNAILTAIRPAASGATEMSDTVRGVQTVFGGNATTAADSLNNGHILTPKLIKKMRTLLTGTTGKYWSNDNHINSSTKKNPHRNGSDGQLWCVIAPESEEALLNDSQFTNAAQLGSDDVIRNGEVKKYMGINFVVSDFLGHYTASDTVYVQGATTALDTNAHEIFMVKSNQFAGLVWGEKPRFHVFDYPSALQKRVIMEQSYHAQELFPDAIVRGIVSDV